MSLFNFINHNKPEPEPEPKPTTAPVLNPSKSEGSNCNEEKVEENNEQEKQLFLEQQNYLSRQRTILTKYGQDYKDSLAKSRVILQNFVGKTHQVSSWNDIWTIAEAVNRQPLADRKYTFVLGGWFASKNIATPQLPPNQLLKNLWMLWVYSEIDRLSGCQENNNYDDFWKMVQSNQELFTSALIDNEWTLGRVLALAEKKIKELKDSIESQFFFLEDRVFCFYPTEKDPLGGWKHFWLFVSSYQYLPEHFRDRFGPYYLTILPIEKTPAK